MEIDQENITKINEHFNRKRMISVFYLIKKLLEEMSCEKYHQIGLKLSKQTFDNYEKWWEYYKLKNSRGFLGGYNPSMESPINNSG